MGKIRAMSSNMNGYFYKELELMPGGKWAEVKKYRRFGVTMRALIAIANKIGMKWYPGEWPGYQRGKGQAADTPEDLSHEIGHYVVAPKRRRHLPHFGLGHPDLLSTAPRPKVRARTAVNEEGRASLVGIALLRSVRGMWRAQLEEHNWVDNADDASEVLVPKLLTKIAYPIINADDINALRRELGLTTIREF